MGSSLNLKSVVVCVPENMHWSKTKHCASSIRLRGKARSRALSAKFTGQPMIMNTNLQDEKASICISRSMQWWKKNLKPNMIEIHSAQELLNSLLTAGDALVVVDFYSPACGGCKTLHPKICQIAEMHPNAIFLKVNYDELKTMCHALQIHVLPFFRFYRGAEGHVCGFSCTNATINKFKRALSKHVNERCSLRPPKGLDELQLTNLVSTCQISLHSHSPLQDLDHWSNANASDSTKLPFAIAS
ncbi:hypothetical protein PIB30_018113 [Stylosanthes scabra]|uniref:Thioredoxin domain-containing protein n=1 Tax=Stylosanthes scabra TaxID=79078 RepID=A0ABU6Z9K6_9FABA|nr:hypothetical protein [Stylosanthes scabra]